MAKAAAKTSYECQHCGHAAPKWLGKCPDCGTWNSFVEGKVLISAAPEQAGFYELGGGRPLAITEITGELIPRHATGVAELDRVLGGGVVRGSLILLGGDPGIGKSTLILMAASRLAESGLTVLYISGEESSHQIKMRAERLGIRSPQLLVLTENSLDRILAHAAALQPDILVIDSIQTVYLAQLESAPGSVSQLRECTGKLLYFAKSTHTSAFLIGHVTKEGALAGPRVLEHMVDCVLYFEGERHHQYRIVRTVKNRFGATQEIGVFEMSEAGLLEVTNPSHLFLSERTENPKGSVVVPSLEGSRPVLVEIQGLVAGSNLANPRRTSIGVDPSRVGLLVAVIERSVGLALYGQDIYVNVTGGLKIQETAVDLGIVVALISSFRNWPIPRDWVMFGEIGLGGELRGVQQPTLRLKEAAKLGFKHALIPQVSDIKGLPRELHVQTASTLSQAIDAIF